MVTVMHYPPTVAVAGTHPLMCNNPSSHLSPTVPPSTPSRVLVVLVFAWGYPLTVAFYVTGGTNWDEHKHQKVDIPHEEQKKNWWDLDDKRKKELEVSLFIAAAYGRLLTQWAPRLVAVSP